MLLEEFNDLLSLEFECPDDLLSASEAIVTQMEDDALQSQTQRHRRLLTLVNRKLRLSEPRAKRFIDAAASARVFFNYQQKREVLEIFDSGDFNAFRKLCAKTGVDLTLGYTFEPVSERETISGLHDLLTTGQVNRSDAKQEDLASKKEKIQRALFGGYVFSSFEEAQVHKCLNTDARRHYEKSYFEHLRHHHGSQLKRECALIYQDFDLAKYSKTRYDDVADLVLGQIGESFQRLANHCYLAIRLNPDPHNTGREWRLFSDLILFAEKHREIELTKGYFKPEKIAEQTKAHLGEDLDLSTAHFEIANEGFAFKDCMILSDSDEEGSNTQPYSLLILLEKNKRDERKIPCPACRSLNVSGNSYPSLGVRSWECKNLICPERSAYDRGNRFSLASIIKQEAILSPSDQIAPSSLRRWRKDVLFAVSDEEILEMLVHHFSLNGDQIVVASHEQQPAHEMDGRSIIFEPFEKLGIYKGLRAKFYKSSFFYRFALERKRSPRKRSTRIIETSGSSLLINGDCETALNSMEGQSVDGAVTSPPYYNAREYSQWPNIYCYLYDMFNAARAVFRVLKPGSLFVYNIFDYFDNEKSLTFSAMGKKRMILGAYIIYLFQLAGFEIKKNVIWYKGDIEGKRNFNQGNTSPYYQLPFNSWEHCLVFKRPGGKSNIPVQNIIKQRPVFKMIQGENRHGHSAPFPEEIPRILSSTLPPSSTILDPYAGSMTTALAAIHSGLNFIMIEKDPDYFELGIRNVREAEARTPDLFGRIETK